MKLKIILFLLLGSFCYFSSFAQIKRDTVASRSGEKKLDRSKYTVSRLRILNTDSILSKSRALKLDLSKFILSSKEKKHKEDTLYCTEIVRRHSWIVGIGDTLSREDALRHADYYRLTLKNANGNWQHVEHMTKNKLSESNSSTNMCYYDGLLLGEVDNKLKSSIFEISQWFEFSDLDGKDLLEERAYDSDGNLVFSAMFDRHDDGRIVVCYNDAHGFPVDFYPDSKYTYGHVFAITYDDNGKDAIIECFDGAGYSRPYAYGCYQYRKVYDKREYVIDRTCHNSVGHLMNNKFGFARTKLDVSDDEKRRVFTRYDVNGDLVKPTVPLIIEGYMIEEREFDDNGELQHINFFIMKDGEKVKDEVDGIHQVDYIYDEDGDSWIYRCYDKEFNEIEL